MSHIGMLIIQYQEEEKDEHMTERYKEVLEKIKSIVKQLPQN